MNELNNIKWINCMVYELYLNKAVTNKYMSQ